MDRLKRNLPPLTSLVVFEAAARLGSFKAAAQELNVTREAVSRQIKALEAFLGVLLFERDANSAVMGVAGQRFFETVSPNLWAIATAATALGGDHQPIAGRPDTPEAREPELEDAPVILVIDDRPDNIRHLAGLLGGEYRVLAQTSAEGALSFLSGTVVDLILLDIRMPGMDGFELCRRIKSTASLAAIPIIFITSLDSPEDESKGLDMGAADFISRPIVPAVLRARVRCQIDLAQSRAALEALLQRGADRLERAEAMLAGIAAEVVGFTRPR